MAPAVAAGPFVFVGGTTAADWSEGLAEAARPSARFSIEEPDPVKLESREIYRRLRSCLEAGGSSLERAVQVNQWVPTYHGEVEREPADRDFHAAHFETWRAIVEPHLRTRDEFIPEPRPASAFLPVDRLLAADARVEVEMVGLRADSGIAKGAFTSDVHVPLGGYSIGIEAGSWLFTAGFIASDYRPDGARGLHPDAAVPDFVWYGNAIAREVDVTLRHLRTAVEAGGAEWGDVVKAVVYLTPFGMANLPALEEVWRRWWPESPPARSIVPVSGMGVRPLNVEVMLIATRPGMGGDREVVRAPTAAPALGHAPQAIRSNEFLFLSSLVAGAARRPTGRGYPHLRREIKSQVGRIHESAQLICEAAGTSIEETVKADLYFSDFNDVAAAMSVWAEAFSRGYPASSILETPPETPGLSGCRLVADLTVYVP